MKTYIRLFGIIAIVVALSVGAGSVLTVADVYPISNFGRKIVKIQDDPLRPGKIFESILFDLKISAVLNIPESKHPQGGDLTSRGDEVLLLTNDGLIYSLLGVDYRLLSFRAPTNNWSSYSDVVKERIQQGKKHNELNLHRLRYNGILVTEVEGKSLLLISYVKWDSLASCYQNVIDSTPIPTQIRHLREMSVDPVWSRVYASRPCLPIDSQGADIHGHVSGGKLAPLGNGKVVLANADFEWDGVSLPPNPYGSEKPLAQDENVEYGKVLEIDLKDGKVRKITSGNRNMQGIAISPANDIWTVEHGPRGGDKLNLHVSGKNFGWPSRTYGTQYSKQPWPGASPFGRMDGFDYPVFAWMPSVAVSDMAYISSFNQSWDGDLLIGSLKAESLFRVRLEAGRGVYSEQIRIGERIRSLVLDSRSRIILWTDSNKILILEKAVGGWNIGRILSEDKSLNSTPDLSLKVKAAIEICAQCHSFERGVDDSAPSLNGLLKRKIGGSNYKGTSESLKLRSDYWTSDRLFQFLSNPSAFATDTKMPSPGLDPVVLERLVSVLIKVDGSAE